MNLYGRRHNNHHPRRRLHALTALHESDESDFDLTGSTVKFLVRRNATADPVISKPIASHTDPAHGLTLMPLEDADTNLALRAWQYQIIPVDALGDDHPSGYRPFLVTNLGSSTDSLPVTVSSGDVTINLALTAPKVRPVPRAQRVPQVRRELQVPPALLEHPVALSR